MTSIFLSQAPTHHNFTFNLRFLYELKHKIRFSLNFECDFQFSIPFRFYKSLYFCSRKCMGSLTLKRHNSFQNKTNRKATHTFAFRPQILKLQQEVLKFNDICVSWSSPKTDLVTSFLNSKN